ESSVAPRIAARFTAVARLAIELLVASTSRMWHFLQVADTMSRSSEISAAQLTLGGGYVVPPVWFTFLKQPLAVVHGGSPNCARYTARSDSALGSSKASMIATV